MSLKVKLTSTIVAFMLILGLTIMGVFAAPTATIQLGGSLNFKATDVHAKVTGVIAGTKVDPQPTLTDLVFESGVTTDVSSWANVPLEFTDAGSEITITVTIENLATDRPLYATLEDTVGEVTNVTKSMKKGADAYTGDVIELPASTGTGTSTAVITLSMKVTDPNASIADDATYGYSIELNNEEPIQEEPEIVQTVSYWNNLETGALDFELNTTDYTAAAKGYSSTTTTGDIVIPSHVKDADGNEYTVTSIVGGNEAPPVGGFSIHSGLVGTITSLVLPDTLITIKGNAFYGNKSLSSIDFGSGLKTIEDSAFTNCSGLTGEIELPEGITSINGAFQHCSGITSVVIPTSLTSIGDYAFDSCTGLASVKILSDITRIGDHAFASCSNLTSIKIPASVTEIDLYAFSASGLKTINYTGTEEQWNAISIDTDGNEPLINATKVYNYTGE